MATRVNYTLLRLVLEPIDTMTCTFVSSFPLDLVFPPPPLPIPLLKRSISFLNESNIFVVVVVAAVVFEVFVCGLPLDLRGLSRPHLPLPLILGVYSSSA